MRIFIIPTEPEAKEAPKYIRHIAKREGKNILKIIQTRPKVFVQWSIRPFEQKQRADGSTDGNIHLIALRLCQKLNLNYEKLLKETYPTTNTHWIHSDLSIIERETIIPELSEKSLRNLLFDLDAIDNHALAQTLEQEFIKLGYNIENWYQDTSP